MKMWGKPLEADGDDHDDGAPLVREASLSSIATSLASPSITTELNFFSANARATSAAFHSPVDEDEEEDDEESDSDESTAPSIPTTLHASPSNAQLGDYTPKCNTAIPPAHKALHVSSRIDIDDAVQNYHRMSELLGPAVNADHVPIITCNATDGSEGVRTVEPVNLHELKHVLEGESEEDIKELYDAIMRELREEGNKGGGEGTSGDGGSLVSRSANDESHQHGEDEESQRDKVECLLDCYASIAAGSTLPSTLGGSASMKDVDEALAEENDGRQVIIETDGVVPRELGAKAAEKKKLSRPGFILRNISSGSKSKSTKQANNKSTKLANNKSGNKNNKKAKADGGIGGSSDGRSAPTGKRPSVFKQMFSKKKRYGAASAAKKGRKKSVDKKEEVAAKDSESMDESATTSMAFPIVTNDLIGAESASNAASAQGDAMSMLSGTTASLIDGAAELLASFMLDGGGGNVPPPSKDEETSVATSSVHTFPTLANNEDDDGTDDVSLALTAGVDSTACKGYEVVRDEERGKDKIMSSRPSLATVQEKATNEGGSVKSATSARTATSKRSIARSVTSAKSAKSSSSQQRQVEASDGLFDDDRSKSSRKAILDEGEVVPEEALSYKRKPKKKLFAEKSKARSGGRDRGRSASARNRSRSINDRLRGRGRTDDKSEKETGKQQKGEGEEEEVGSLWEDASRRSKPRKLLLEDGAIVPKEAFRQERLAKSKKNMCQSPSLAQKKPASIAAEEEQSGEHNASGGAQRFLSPKRFRSLSRGRSTKPVPESEMILEDAGKDSKPKKGAVRFVSPLRFRSPMRSRGDASPTCKEKAVEKKATEKKATEGKAAEEKATEEKATEEKVVIAAREEEAPKKEVGKEPEAPLQVRLGDFRPDTPDKSSTEELRGVDPDGIVASSSGPGRASLSISKARGTDRKKSSRSKKSTRSKSSKTSSRKKTSSDNASVKSSSSKKSLRGWKEDSFTDDDVTFVERELLALPEKLVSKAWFNLGIDSRSYESTVDDIRQDEEAMAEERTGWFNWNATIDSDDEDLTDKEGVDDALREGADGAAGGWFSPLANYFADPHLGDLGLTDVENDRDDRRSRRSSKSRMSRRSKSASRSRRSRSKASHRSKGATRSRKSHKSHHREEKLEEDRAPTLAI